MVLGFLGVSDISSFRLVLWVMFIVFFKGFQVEN